MTGTDADIQRAFDTAFRMLSNRISAFVNLPVESLEAQVLKERLGAIGEMEDAAAMAVSPRP